MADLRASDADRELIVEGLRFHHGTGRLTDDELEQRLAVAFAARTQGELTRLVADLPPPEGLTVAPSAADRWQDVRYRAGLSGQYSVVGEGPGWIVLERATRPWWVWLLVVLTFPIGLLALLIRERARTVVSLTDAGELRVQGGDEAGVRALLGRG